MSHRLAHRSIRVLLATLPVLLILLSHHGAGQPNTPGDRAPVEPGVLLQLEKTGKAPVIILLKENSTLHDIEAIKNYTSMIQQDLLGSLSVLTEDSSVWERISDWWQPRDLVLSRQYATAAALAGELRGMSLDEVSLHPAVAAISLDRLIRINRIPALEQASISQAHALSFDGKQLTGAGHGVCIIDTGIDYTHPELTPLYGGGKDIVNNDNDPTDDHGHGTHVAGIIHASAPNATLISVKAMTHQGSGTISNVLAGIDWCTLHKQSHNISVIAMSIGDQGSYTNQTCPTTFDSAIASATTAGIITVAASGNDAHPDGVSMPACTPNVIAVGSVSRSDSISPFTNRGALLDLLAPGEGITSTKMGGGFTTLSGTSMAVPFVAGTITLLLQYNTLQGLALDSSDLISRLTSSGVQIQQWKRLNAYAAAQALGPEPGAVLLNTTFSITTQNTESQGMSALPARITIQRQLTGQRADINSSAWSSLSSGHYDTTITPHQQEGSIFSSLTFSHLTIATTPLTLGIHNLSPSNLPFNFTNGLTLNISHLSFSNGSITFPKKAARLYHCTQWNRSTRDCTSDQWLLEPEEPTPDGMITTSIQPGSPGIFQQQDMPLTVGQDPSGISHIPSSADTTLLDPTHRVNTTTAPTLIKEHAGKAVVIHISNGARGLFFFNTSSIPPNASIQNATLNLWRLDTSTNASIPAMIYRITSPWSQGTTRGLGQPDGATWNTTNGTAFWNHAGGDMSPGSGMPASFSNHNQTLPRDSRAVLTLTPLVSGSVNGTWPNHGWIIIANQSELLADHTFASSEHPNISQRPLLEVQWIEQERIPPRINTTWTSSSYARRRDSFCLLAHVVDETNISSVVAHITTPSNQTKPVPLTDTKPSCNSITQDNIYTAIVPLTETGTYTWTTLTAHDGIGNENTSSVNQWFTATEEQPGPPSLVSPTQIMEEQPEGPLPIDLSLINSSNNVAAAFSLPPATARIINANWNLQYTREFLQQAIVHVLHNSPGANLSLTLEHYNGTAWNTQCSLTVPPTPQTSSCNISLPTARASAMNNASIRLILTHPHPSPIPYFLDSIHLTVTALNDTIPPSITNITITPDHVFPGNTTSFSAHIQDDTGISHAGIMINTTNGTTVMQALTSQGAGIFSGHYTFPASDQTGTYTFIVTANDTSGNTNRSPGFPIIVIAPNSTSEHLLSNQTSANQSTNTTMNQSLPHDITSPSISELSQSPTTAPQGSSIVLAATIQDEGTLNLTQTTIQLPNQSSRTLPLSPISPTRYASVFSETNLTGRYQWTVTAQDTSGNLNTSPPGEFIIEDQQAPWFISIQIQPPTFPNTSLTINATIADNTEPASATAIITRSDTTTINYSLNHPSPDTFMGTYTFAPSDPAGTYSLTITATDSAGNSNTSPPQSFTVNQTPTTTPTTPATPETSAPTCQPSWTCTAFSGCEEGYQTRTCTDQHTCAHPFSKPPERQPCTQPITTKQTQSITPLETSSRTPTPSPSTTTKKGTQQPPNQNELITTYDRFEPSFHRALTLVLVIISGFIIIGIVVWNHRQCAPLFPRHRYRLIGQPPPLLTAHSPRGRIKTFMRSIIHTSSGIATRITNRFRFR